MDGRNILKRMVIRILLLFSVLLLLVSCTGGGYDPWDVVRAERGNVGAQFNVGVMYIKGQGAPQDYTVALKWYRMAAEQGLADAQNGLGEMYRKGQGVARNYSMAYMWFDLAGINGDKKSSGGKKAVAGKMTVEEIAEARKMSRDWMKKHR